MSAESQLKDAYREWSRLAEFEGRAIEAGNWDHVADCQEKMRALQGDIVALTQRANGEWQQPGVDRSAHELDLRTCIQRVIEQEYRNNTLLNSLLETTRTRLGSLDQSRHNLRRIQRSYAPVKAAAWTSFS